MDIELIKMPSTSPAHAGMSFEQKLADWRRLLDYLG
jgi:G:T/U-mismatch repair DNA glycosylase